MDKASRDVRSRLKVLQCLLIFASLIAAAVSVHGKLLVLPVKNANSELSHS